MIIQNDVPMTTELHALEVSQNQLRALLNKYYILSEIDFQELLKLVEFAEIDAGIILEQGKHAKLEYLILEGICRAYVSGENIDEKTLDFYSGMSGLSPLKSRVYNKRSTISLEAITHTKLAKINSEELFQLTLKSESIRILAIKLMEFDFMRKSEKEISLASLQAKDKLIYLRKIHPGIENYVPLNYIASYLGITNVSLSRLRAGK